MTLVQKQRYSKTELEASGVLTDKGTGRNFYWKSNKDGKTYDLVSAESGRLRLYVPNFM